MLPSQSTACPFALPDSTTRTYHWLFDHSPTKAQLGCFQFLPVVNNAFINIHVPFFAWTQISFFWDKHQEEALLGIMAALCFTSPWWLRSEKFTCQCRRRRFNSWIGKIPWRRKWEPTPVLTWRIHGQRSLAHYRPWGCKELDTTEWLIYDTIITTFLYHFF